MRHDDVDGGTGESPPPLWLPFTRSELELGFGAYGFAATALAVSGLQPEIIAWLTVGLVIVAYLAGLLVYARRHRGAFSLVVGGAVQGQGYIPLVTSASKSLLLVHVDDDPPSEELLAVYRRLLRERVQLRRLLFVRADSLPESYRWVEGFGDHEGLEHRLVLPGQAEATRMSFVVIDEETVVLSIPGSGATAGKSYREALLFHDLLVIRDRRVAASFVEAHRQVWTSAVRLRTVNSLGELLRSA